MRQAVAAVPDESGDCAVSTARRLDHVKPLPKVIDAAEEIRAALVEEYRAAGNTTRLFVASSPTAKEVARKGKRKGKRGPKPETHATRNAEIRRKVLVVGKTQAAVANEFGLSEGTISRIVNKELDE